MAARRTHRYGGNRSLDQKPGPARCRWHPGGGGVSFRRQTVIGAVRCAGAVRCKRRGADGNAVRAGGRERGGGLLFQRLRAGQRLQHKLSGT